MPGPNDFGPYSSVRPYFGTAPAWITGADTQRVQAYDVYERMYWNEDATFKVIQRGSESKPLYVPTARMLVEATNRFLARGFSYVVDPTRGTPENRAELAAEFNRLFRRERFFPKFRDNKRYGLIRGDAMVHIVADPNKPSGRRISIYAVEPGRCFKITDPDDDERIIGWHITQQVVEGGKDRIKRQTYRKTDTGAITSESAIFEPDGWDDRDPEIAIKQVRVVNPVATLPSQITTLPVYHVRNMGTGDFGSSELRGVERVLAGINQAWTDEELALALDGIGMYATTSGPPRDEDGNETNWTLGPGRVVELDPGSNMNRVQGVGSFTPFQEHVKGLNEATQRALATPDIAVGTVDVQIAQSGIALQLQMGPMLAKNEEKVDEILAVHDNLFWDIVNGWLPAYESMNLTDCDVVPIVGEPLPEDRDARIKEIMALATSTPPIISVQYAQLELAKFGYEFPEDIMAQIAGEAPLRAALFPDEFTERAGEELGNETGGAADAGTSAAGTPAGAAQA